MLFLAGWWNFCQWGPNWLQNCSLALLHRSPAPLLPLSLAYRSTIFLNAASDKDRYKIGMWAEGLGGRILHCSSWVLTQQEAELEAMIHGERLCEHIGWPVSCLVGDNESALEQTASFCARSGLKRQNRHLRRLFYVGAGCSPLYTFLGCLAT